MKKLEAIDLKKCDELTHKQMASLVGGDEPKTQKSFLSQETTVCANDVAWVAEWDDGTYTYDMDCPVA